MCLKIKKQIIAAGIISALVIFSGCISDDSKKLQDTEFEPAKKDNLTGYVNVSNTNTEIEPIPGKEENFTGENDTLFTDEENLSESQPASKQKPYGEDAIYINYDPVIIYGSLPGSREIEYIKEDKVIFKFLYSERCPVCKSALPSVPKIKEEFGERVIVEEIDIYSKDAEIWRNGAKEYIDAERFPFTLSIGMNSLIDDEVELYLVSYTQGFNAGTYEHWKRNICGQFRDKPGNCEGL